MIRNHNFIWQQAGVSFKDSLGNRSLDPTVQDPKPQLELEQGYTGIIGISSVSEVACIDSTTFPLLQRGEGICPTVAEMDFRSLLMQ